MGVLLLGDLNVRSEEFVTLTDTGVWQDAYYDGKSWNPMSNRFYEQEPGFREEGLSFDRMLYRGDVWIVSFLAGTGRRWADGRGYALSDHFAVYGLLDVHACHGSSGVRAVREQRRVDLGKHRDARAIAEKEFVTAQERGCCGTRIGRVSRVLLWSSARRISASGVLP